MGFRLANIHEYNRFIAVDIGSYRVRAAIYEVKDGRIECLGDASVRQKRNNILDGEISDMQGVSSTIENAIAKASHDLEITPDDIIISFSSREFLFDAITTQYVRADKESTLTMEEIDNMIKKIERKSFQSVVEKSKAHFGEAHDDLRLVSSTLTSIYIDGKRVSNPIGFSGKNIKMTVFNVFAPSSEFNVMKSILASLRKKTISLVPTPLVFPKIVEQTKAIYDNNCYIDIGQLQTTILIESKNEIISFETFPFGVKLFLDEIARHFPHLPALQVENLIFSITEDEKFLSHEGKKYAPYLHDFLSYITDIILAYLSQQKDSLKIDAIFASGSMFSCSRIRDMLAKNIEGDTGSPIAVKYILDEIEEEIDAEQLIPYGLSIIALELLMVKKDPLIRILRYVLYQYD